MNFNTGKNNVATNHEDGHHLALDNSSKLTGPTLMFEITKYYS